MADFKDLFDRANIDLHNSNGWSSGSQFGGAAHLVDGFAMNKTGSFPSLSVQNTAAPAGVGQRVRASVVCTTFHVKAKLGIGTFELGEPSLDAIARGYAIILDFSAYTGLDPRVTAKLVSYNGAATPDLYDVLTVPVDVTEIMEKSSGSPLSVFQDLMLIQEPAEGGVHLRGYVNQDDEAKPILTFVGRYESLAATPLYGRYFFTFDAHPTPNTLGLSFFEGADYTAETVALLPDDRPTAGDVIEGALDRYRGYSNTQVGDVTLLRFVRSAQADIINALGDMALFVNVYEPITVEIGADRTFTLPEHVEKVHGLWRNPSRLAVPFYFHGMDSKGRLVLSTGISASVDASFFIEYRTRVREINTRDDKLVVPRQFQELIEIAVCRRVSMFDSNKGAREMFYGEEGRLMFQLKGQMNKMLRMRKRTLSVESPRYGAARYESELNHRGY